MTRVLSPTTPFRLPASVLIGLLSAAAGGGGAAAVFSYRQSATDTRLDSLEAGKASDSQLLVRIDERTVSIMSRVARIERKIDEDRVGQ